MEGTNYALRVGRLSNGGTRRVVRNIFGDITHDVGSTIGMRRGCGGRVPSAGNILW